MSAQTYRGWSIDWEYGQFAATGPNYDASYEGHEDGWVDNGERVFARTIDDLKAEVDCWITEHCQHCDGEGKVWNNADPTSGQYVECDKCAGEPA